MADDLNVLKELETARLWARRELRSVYLRVHSALVGVENYHFDDDAALDMLDNAVSSLVGRRGELKTTAATQVQPGSQAAPVTASTGPAVIVPVPADSPQVPASPELPTGNDTAPAGTEVSQPAAVDNGTVNPEPTDEERAAALAAAQKLAP